MAADIDTGKRNRRRSPERRRRSLAKRCEWHEGCAEYAAPREAYCSGHLRQLQAGARAAQN